MLIARIQHDGRVRYGAVEGDRIRFIAGSPFARRVRPGGRPIPLDRVTLLAPCLPTKIIGVGRNYAAHAKEMGAAPPAEPLFFLKAPSALLDPGGAIRCPALSGRVEYEGELAVVILRPIRDVSPAGVDGTALGYTCFNDVTARDLQQKDGQWARAKSFDTFAPCGPWIATDLDPEKLEVRTYVNGVLRQRAATSEMLFGIRELVSRLSRVMTLLPGDLIATGTPEGVGPLRPGDRVAVVIEGIGRLENTASE